MAWLELPTRTDLAAYSYRIQLEGETYTLTFTYNDRMDRWFLRLGDQFGNTLIEDVPMAVNWPLFQRFVTDGLPPGDFFAFDTSGKGQEAGRFDLGDRVRLIYRESA